MNRMVITVLLCCSFLMPALATADSGHNVTKFTFTNVSYGDPFPDGSGLIRASTKITNKSTVIVCGYYLEPNDQYLGQFQVVDDPTFPGTEPSAVEDFCLANFSNRSM